ncbi:MAG: amidohydrolase [Parvularculaceae bacterium]|nr:amidohydrolase [Parvularculaceae bacterium]
MRKLTVAVLFFAAACVLAACGKMTGSSRARPGDGAVIFQATIITMDPARPSAGAVAVKDGKILAVGDVNDLVEAYSGARVDEIFLRKTILPGFIDPHIHMTLSSLMYATAMAPPWPVAGANAAIEGYPDRASFLQRLIELDARAPLGESGAAPLVVYGFHNLVHGELTRADLDAVTTARPLIVWHYSGHDFYLNSKAIEWANITGDLHAKFEGVDIDENGEPTGRVFEDAAPYLMQTLGPILLDPARVSEGLVRLSQLLRSGGVTTVADLGYGLFGLAFENANISRDWVSPDHSGYRLYLVPESRAFESAFGADRVQAILDMASGKISAPAPVLKQVKFFTDGAFYSQTMRLSDPGYLEGGAKGTKGLWVLKPGEIAETIRPYWDGGLGVHIHSNGDEAQDATLDALETLRARAQSTQKSINSRSADARFVIEHAGLFSPDQVERAGALDATISAASHYVFYLGEAFQGALGETRGRWITPLASLSAAGMRVALHSDAPLAPPSPLRAASAHLTRATREGGVLTPSERLSPAEALEAITIDAAYALGLENEIGSIAPGKRADFTILNSNPLATAGENWGAIGVWGVVLGGEKRPLAQ